MATKRSSKKKAADPNEPLHRHDAQAFVMERIKRSQMVASPYNPRRISDDARRKLKKGLETMGLLAPPTWNRRSGRIVAGHQRLSTLDQLSDSADYELDVAVVDLSEEDEKAANLLLNTDTVTGDFDLDLLSSMLSDPLMDLDKTGFDSADIYKLFGGDPRDEHLDAAGLDAVAEKVRESRDRYNQISEKMKSRDSEAFYVVVIFRDSETRQRVLTELGLPDNRYADVRSFSGKTFPVIS